LHYQRCAYINSLKTVSCILNQCFQWIVDRSVCVFHSSLSNYMQNRVFHTILLSLFQVQIEIRGLCDAAINFERTVKRERSSLILPVLRIRFIQWAGVSIIQMLVPGELSGSPGQDSNTIFVPSGDQDGAPSYPLLFVTRRGVPPETGRM